LLKNADQGPSYFETLAALAPQILCWLSSALAGFEELIWIEGLFVFEHGVECME